VILRKAQRALLIFKNKNNYSKFAQDLLDNGHSFGKIEDIIQILYYNNKGSYMDTIEKFYIYRETANNKQINDRHAVNDQQHLLMP
jgi:hypothetical protein